MPRGLQGAASFEGCPKAPCAKIRARRAQTCDWRRIPEKKKNGTPFFSEFILCEDLFFSVRFLLRRTPRKQWIRIMLGKMGRFARGTSLKFGQPHFNIPRSSSSAMPSSRFLDTVVRSLCTTPPVAVKHTGVNSIFSHAAMGECLREARFAKEVVALLSIFIQSAAQPLQYHMHHRNAGARQLCIFYYAMHRSHWEARR